jgi:hypothetical protein
VYSVSALKFVKGGTRVATTPKKKTTAKPQAKGSSSKKK